jgi:hypothetical protein
MLQRRLLRSIDRDALGFRFFRDHTEQVDAQQAVAQGSVLDLDVIGQTERQLEGSLSDALMQERDALVSVTLAATDGQHTLLDLQVQVFFLETGGRNDDTVLVITVFFDVVGWVAAAWLVAQGGFEQVVETVETYRGTEQWCERK